MFSRALLAGVALWVLGTIVFRFAGPATIHPPSVGRTIPAYALNFLLAGLVVRLAFPLLRVPRESWPSAVTLFILPTLVLDAFATAFFPAVFPNLAPAAAPTFGGLMLISAAGAVVSAWVFNR
ncbi:MAG TPA: DUF5367 family protein [Gemmatimonadaceae bacterium]|jgi:hypothetical protein